MTKCPFCHFDNEDGALFCEQCKSDLGNVPFTVSAAVATAEPAGQEVVMAEAVPIEAVPAGTVEAIPDLVAEPTYATAEAVETIPMAQAEALLTPVEVQPNAEAAPVAPASPPPPPGLARSGGSRARRAGCIQRDACSASSCRAGPVAARRSAPPVGTARSAPQCRVPTL